MNRAIPFVKATACGNDFLLIEGGAVAENERKALTQRMCDRHLGIGADGVEWLFSTDQADIYAKLINSDGSDAEVSGNGTRCVAAWHTWKNLTQYHRPPDGMDDLLTTIGTNSLVRVLTDAGVKSCTLVKQLGTEFEFRSDMGEPAIDGEHTLSLSGGERRGFKLSTGNPQFIVFVDDFTPDWQVEGAEIQSHHEFPQRTNVEFVKVVGPREIEIRIFERGAGETKSSGTGSCASAVAAIHTGRAKSPVRVVSPGGAQTVEWDGGSVFLTGPARILCRGEFFV
ncbi:MAG: diaminopimelate epimerase [Terriglobales bacterium]